MKKIIVLAVMASLFALAGCTSNPPCQSGCATKAPAPCHHDYKGESFK